MFPALRKKIRWEAPGFPKLFEMFPAGVKGVTGSKEATDAGAELCM